MSTYVPPRAKKDHWSVRLHIKRPGAASRPVLLILAALQAILLLATGSSLAKGGGLYGCATGCKVTPAHQTLPLAVLFGVAVLVLPVILGIFSRTWQEAVTLAVLPWWVALLTTAAALLSPVSKDFGTPFWLDSTRVLLIGLSLALFAGLGWLGWVIHQAATSGK